MSNVENSFLHDPEALIDLLEDIVASYQDNDSRPHDALSLYRQRIQLGASYRAKLNKRFVVVDGGASHRPARQIGKANMISDQPHLKLVTKTTPYPTGQTITDYALKPGESQIIQAGRNGEITVRYRLTYEDGKLRDLSAAEVPLEK